MTWVSISGRDVALEALDFGGEGDAVLLLHGLAGTAAEWADTASWLTERHRVVALDQRGHGRSARRPEDVSRAAFVADAAAAIEELRLDPAVVVGHSLGGHTALLLAAGRPELVRALVVAEASPAEESPATAAEVGRLLASWPVPFPDRTAALEFFGGDTLRAHAWVSDLVETDEGLVPAFDVDVLVAALEAALEPRWKEWAAIRAPVLVVRGESGALGAEDSEVMLRALPGAHVVTVPGGHDVHLDDPGAWRAAVEGFLAGLS